MYSRTMKLLCDEMLKGLARWLRAAGHDTELAYDGEPDRELIARARDTQRLLLTRDRKLLEHRNAKEIVCLLACNALDDCASELHTRIGINWLYKPFTRCLQCNTPLDPYELNGKELVPEDVKDGPLFQCPVCERIFWEGGHVKRMRKKLYAWNNATR